MTNMLIQLSDYQYSAEVYKLVKEAESAAKKTLYVSLNKTYKSLVEQFKSDGIDPSKFVFVDTITATIIPAKNRDDCAFLDSPDDVKALYAGIIKMVKTHDAEMVIFDSLSALTTYKNIDEIERFVTVLLGSLSLLNCPAAFTCLKIDIDKPLIQHIRMKVDKTIEMG
jgi:archaellum biogenesis ATPase FlaH